ncbi:HutD/Ves family protein [Erwinia sorbitola]|uniref:HutD family protein n=1 Tax=Erwinia sorbitola TaxID=2681984 RepID=A0A6I6EUN5_9GAMM|nr:HutD family protein [Erwinia sorbitola]MTD26703.1 HutD family protein [Erwinia sorbitola]QGU88272.1 HutD family protein [Erwinia sorbitola]
MIHLYDSSRLPASRWRNGGGETREIVSYPPGLADFEWRISIATIAADGDFSLFPGIDRIITLLSGEVALYRHGNLYHQLGLHQPFAFAGEDAISARLAAQTSTDFNIMARRDIYQPEAGITTAPFSPVATAAGVVYVLAGHWQHQQTLLAAGQGAWWENNAGTFIPASANAQLLWGKLIPR